MIDLDKLEELAKAATPGPWNWTDGLEGFMAGCQEHEEDITEEGLCPNATAAADAILALVQATAAPN